MLKQEFARVVKHSYFDDVDVVRRYGFGIGKLRSVLMGLS